MALCGADRHSDGQKYAGNENSPRSWGSFLNNLIGYFCNLGNYLAISSPLQIRAFYGVFRRGSRVIGALYGLIFLMMEWGSWDRIMRYPDDLPPQPISLPPPNIPL